MWVTDPQGRLRVIDAVPDGAAVSNQGFAFTPAGNLYVGVITPVNYLNGVAATALGRMGIAPTQPAVVYNKAWPQLNNGAAIQHLNVPVPVGTAMNGGIAMDNTGVYMTTTVAPPAPTTIIDPLTDDRITFTRAGGATGYPQ